MDAGIVAMPVARPAGGGFARPILLAFKGSAAGGSGELSAGAVRSRVCEVAAGSANGAPHGGCAADGSQYVKTFPDAGLVAAGYGVGFSSAAHLAGCHQADVVVRPLPTASLTTYLLRPEGEIMEPLRQFIDRVGVSDARKAPINARCDAGILDGTIPFRSGP